MQLFYSTIQDSPNWLISDDEAHHCIKVLRHKVGDELEVMDGRGNWVVGTITAITKKNVSIKVLSFRQKDQIPSPQLHLAFPPVKNMSRLEWMMEKAVEVGITDFWLVQTERTEKTQVRLDRLEKIILSAAKQSLKCWLPDIHALTPLPAWLKTTGELPCRMYGAAAADVHLSACYTGGEGVFLVGPEGDFTPAEYSLLDQHGWRQVHLGPHRLRTETAILSGGILMAQHLKK